MRTSLLILFAPTLALAQATADTLSVEQLKPLVNNRTWAITFGGDLKDPGTTAYWDFKGDGTLCGRYHGSKAGTKCAEIGQWKLQDDAICWQFQFIGGGESYGYKSMCIRARKTDGKNVRGNRSDWACTAGTVLSRELTFAATQGVKGSVRQQSSDESRLAFAAAYFGLRMFVFFS